MADDANDQEMERLKAEWGHAARAGRISGIKGWFRAVFSDGVSAVIFMAGVVGAIIVLAGISALNRYLGGFLPFPGIWMVIGCAIPLAIALKVMSWWRQKTGRAGAAL